MSTDLPTGPFLLEGERLEREELRERAGLVASDPDRPEWMRNLHAFLRDYLDPDVTLVQRTSGTTGDPRSFILDRRAMMASAGRTLSVLPVKAGDRALLCLPVEYIAGKMMVVRALAGGWDLVPVEPRGRPLSGWEGEAAVAAMVPLQVFQSITAGDPVERIGHLLVGGGEIPPELRSRLEEAERPLIYETFGMSETYTHIALRRLNGPGPDPGFRWLDGVEVYTDHRGCLVASVKGIGGGAVVTNDLVEIDRENRFFVWKGRIDNVIKTGGIKVIPELLEERIASLLGVNCLVLPIPDPRLGQRLALVVERKGPVPEKEWLELLRRELPSHELPRSIISMESIPRNASFKPDRKETLGRIRPGS